MWEELQDIDKTVDRLRDRVRRAIQPPPADARELVTVVSQEISCSEDDLSEHFAVFYNGSPDTFLLHRLSVQVSYKPSGSIPAVIDRRVSMERYAFGYMDRSIPAFPPPLFMFDFVWNYLINSRQSVYSRQPLGSSIFNGLERSQTFDLYEPLILKPVDSIEFRMRPTMYALPGTVGKDAGTTYFVNFLAFGYRRPL